MTRIAVVSAGAGYPIRSCTELIFHLSDGRRQMDSATDADSGIDDLMSEMVRELEAEQSRIVVRLEMRKFCKPAIIIDGIPGKQEDLERITRDLKRRFATGGSTKDGVIILQGDHRKESKEQLERLGYPSKSIEVQ